MDAILLHILDPGTIPDDTRRKGHHSSLGRAAYILHGTRVWTRMSGATVQSPAMIVEMGVALRYGFDSYDQNAKILLVGTEVSHQPILHLSGEELFACPLVLNPPRLHAECVVPVDGEHGEMLEEVLGRTTPEKHLQTDLIQVSTGCKTGNVSEMKLEVMVPDQSSMCSSVSRPVLVQKMARGGKGSMPPAAVAVGAGVFAVDVDAAAVADAGEVGVVNAVAVDVYEYAAGKDMTEGIACHLDDIALDDVGAIDDDAVRVGAPVEEEAA
ncbi:MAG: hypothetical protein JOS17DRAFT_753491 [Linnemannia elongata]|nr:MAG: hypothetical protein JOS17DRAFT_753491 [Linnemannia elongata]